ncbi:MAG: hypothetical protein HY298_12400 [Verrucomicrobia bacterium]|nr:hypothetical protein [Verrucomicrobiota bacterium]
MGTKQKSPVQEDSSGQSTVSADPARQAEDTNVEIVSANLRALETIYFTAMLEEARLFEVVDRLVAMFSRGMLPLGPGRAGAMLYRHWKGHHSRLTTAQRRNVYARAFGLPGGDADVMPNREFNDLWMSFVSIVGMYSAELQSLPPGERSVSAEEVLVSGRTLAINLSAHGHGLAWFAAQDFKAEIPQAIELLSDAELQNAFGAKDPWQVIHNVAASELGARPNVPRAHTRANSGVIIIRWLANRRARLLRPRSANILRHEDIVEGRTAASQNKKATVYPTDSDLVTACEQWLGVTGTQEAELKGEAAPVPPFRTPPPKEEQRDQVA